MLRKDRHNTRFTFVVLAGTVNVRVPENRVSNSELMGVGLEVEFHRILAHPIGINRLDDVALRRRKFNWLAINAAATLGIYDLAHCLSTACFQQIQRANYVGLGE